MRKNCNNIIGRRDDFSNPPRPIPLFQWFPVPRLPMHKTQSYVEDANLSKESTSEESTISGDIQITAEHTFTQWIILLSLISGTCVLCVTDFKSAKNKKHKLFLSAGTTPIRSWICWFPAWLLSGFSCSSRHVGTLGKSFTRSCLRRFGMKHRHSICAVSGAPLSSSGLEKAL